MLRRGTFWEGILPFALGMAFFLGCCIDNTGMVNAAGSEADVQSAATTGTEQPARKKSSRPSSKSSTAKASSQTLPDSAPGTPLPGAQKKYTGKPVSLDLMDADLRNVLRLLADLTSTNIVIEPDVAGKVTLKVDQVPWDHVLDMVLAMNDLGKEQVGNVIRIAKQGKLRQEWQQQVEAIRAKQELNESSKDLGELATVYIPVSFAKPSEIASKITDSKSERGKVAVDDRTSLIIYTDYPARVANARQLISRLDRATPQVLIEARIITLKNTVSRNLGVNLSFSATHTTQNVSPTQNFAINPPVLGIPQFDMTIGQLIGKTLINVDLAVQALETANEARVVAAPRVMTLDNVKASVTQGQQVPYLKVSDAISNVASTEFKDATLELQVTPHITPDRKVRMTIDAKQDTVSETLYNGEPAIDTRKVSSELLVDDGNVIVIGGVIDNSFSHTKTATPGISNIPILGRLFKSEESKEDRNELLIFISPKIVDVTKPADRS